jgi:hypothetical protein
MSKMDKISKIILALGVGINKIVQEIGKFIKQDSSRLFLSLLALFSICYAINRETFDQNETNFLFLPFKALFSPPEEEEYIIEEQIDTNHALTKYIFVLDNSLSIIDDGNKHEATDWYYNTIKDYNIATEGPTNRFKTKNITNYDILKMKLIWYLLALKKASDSKEIQDVKVAIYSVGNEPQRIYPAIGEDSRFDKNIRNALIEVHNANNNKDEDTDFISLFKLLQDSIKTEQSYRVNKTAEYVLVILSDLIQDTERRLTSEYGNNKKDKDNKAKEDKEVLKKTLQMFCVQNFITNTIIITNRKSKSNSLKYPIMPYLDTCLTKNVQIKHYYLDSKLEPITNEIFLNKLKFYYSNPYNIDLGSRSIVNIKQDKNMNLSLISLRNNVISNLWVDYKLNYENKIYHEGRLIINNKPQTLFPKTDKSTLSLKYNDYEIPDEKEIRPAIKMTYNGTVPISYIIPITFVRVLSKPFALAFIFIEIILLFSFLWIIYETLSKIKKPNGNFKRTSMVVCCLFSTIVIFLPVNGFCNGNTLVAMSISIIVAGIFGFSVYRVETINHTSEKQQNGKNLASTQSE